MRIALLIVCILATAWKLQGQSLEFTPGVTERFKQPESLDRILPLSNGAFVAIGLVEMDQPGQFVSMAVYDAKLDRYEGKILRVLDRVSLRESHFLLKDQAVQDLYVARSGTGNGYEIHIDRYALPDFEPLGTQVIGEPFNRYDKQFWEFSPDTSYMMLWQEKPVSNHSQGNKQYAVSVWDSELNPQGAFSWSGIRNRQTILRKFDQRLDNQGNIWVSSQVRGSEGMQLVLEKFVGSDSSVQSPAIPPKGSNMIFPSWQILEDQSVEMVWFSSEDSAILHICQLDGESLDTIAIHQVGIPGGIGQLLSGLFNEPEWLHRSPIQVRIRGNGNIVLALEESSLSKSPQGRVQTSEFGSIYLSEYSPEGKALWHYRIPKTQRWEEGPLDIEEWLSYSLIIDGERTLVSYLDHPDHRRVPADRIPKHISAIHPQTETDWVMLERASDGTWNKHILNEQKAWYQQVKPARSVPAGKHTWLWQQDAWPFRTFYKVRILQTD
ncbi:hypothetical protein [Pontibacter sp. G13]|uniref:hypothetical protein n=1 Tax=Pontibacter sp. G13 TaxID=3074898 RepID=UPI00288B29AE|nr:hypothetical protein [Pontibacter sp. G13]WNJ21358.1 hypothetical protein RJD25_12895 [Pontibacter sp. G13]